MSASNEWTEWHLTPDRGWVEGSNRTDFSRPVHVEPPANRLLTVTYREYASSIYSSLDRSQTEDWRSPDADAIAAALKRFGPPPEKL